MTSVVVFGAGGRAGRQIMAEADRRGIKATPVVRDPAKHPDIADAVAGDVTDAQRVEQAARGHDVAVCAVYAAELDPAAYGPAMEALLQGLQRAGVRRLLLVGIATTLPGEDGTRLFEAPGFPAEWRPFSQARADELAVLEQHDGEVDWVVFIPPAELIEDESRRGYRMQNLGGPLSYTALAEALLDEATASRHHRVQLGISGN
jgi:putative NADH-flavin reductase